MSFHHSENTAVGATALNALTTGTVNTGIGVRAGLVLTEGDRNTFIGKS